MIFYVPGDCVLNYDFVLHTGQEEYFGHLIFGIFQVINTGRAVFFESNLWANFWVFYLLVNLFRLHRK